VPGGTGGFFPVHGESIELPEPFRVGPGTVPLGVEFAMPGALQGEAKGDLPGPFPGFSVSCAFGMACTLLGQTAWLSGGAQILCEVTKWDDEGNPLEWWYPYAGGGLVWMLDAQAFGLRHTINTPGLDGKRNIPLLEGMPEPAGLLDEVDATTYDGHGVKLYLDKSKSFGALHYMPSLRPLRTDVDMEITGMDTFGETKSQKCKPYFSDPDKDTVVTVRVTLPGGKEGFQGLDADRTVYLNLPEGCFTATDGDGNQPPSTGSGSCQMKKGDQEFVWKLTRTEAEMPIGAKIEAWVGSIGPGDPQVNAVSFGNVDTHPAAVGDRQADGWRVPFVEAAANEPCKETEPGGWFSQDPGRCGPFTTTTEPLWWKKDACGNRAEIWCRVSPSGARFFSYEYNGNPVARCVYDEGKNLFAYRMTKNGRRFHSLWHLNVEPGKSQGTANQKDWSVTLYDCIANARVFHECREDPDIDPWETLRNPDLHPERYGSISGCEDVGGMPPI